MLALESSAFSWFVENEAKSLAPIELGCSCKDWAARFSAALKVRVVILQQTQAI